MNGAFIYIDTQQVLDQWVAYLSCAQQIAVDTESNSFHRYREKVCLIQMSALGQDAIVDTLALPDVTVLASVFEDPHRIKIFHDAGYDLLGLHRDFGFRIRGLFDTMLASRLLGWRQFGLASILQARFNFEANKRLQRSDWARRPLSPAQLAYARYDTHFLPQLAHLLTQELQACGRLAWAYEDFERLPTVCERLAEREPAPDHQGFWRIPGSSALSPAAKGCLQALYQLRETLAERLDRPPFKIWSDSVLMDLAQHPPACLQALRPRPGLRWASIRRFGPHILEALDQAQPIEGGPPPGAGRRRRSGRLSDPEARDRYEALRALRRNHAESLGLDPEVALGNAFLETLARHPPASLRELELRGELEGWRGPIFTQAIYDLLNPAHPIHSQPQVRPWPWP